MSDRDAVDYQTMFARRDGAVAAPTAGLHFTPALLDALTARGVGRVAVTLHVRSERGGLPDDVRASRRSGRGAHRGPAFHARIARRAHGARRGARGGDAAC